MDNARIENNVFRIAVIDNYDSFTYNLVQYLGELVEQEVMLHHKHPVGRNSCGETVLFTADVAIHVYRNDAVTVKELQDLQPSHIIISPGPGGPSDAGISNDVIRQLGPHIPLLGVCLGHQCIGQVYGGRVVRAPRLMHGKVSPIFHYDNGLFVGVPSPFDATRYHSLIVTEPLPPDLQITAFTQEGELMGLRHRTYPIFGVQFHPESILTALGKVILRNFLEIAPHPDAIRDAVAFAN